MPRYKVRLPHITIKYYEAEFHAPDDATAHDWGEDVMYAKNPHDHVKHLPQPTELKPNGEVHTEWGDGNEGGGVNRILENEDA